jgi:hypothetical protein
MPGLYDLLPTYRCLEKEDKLDKLTSKEVAALGGDEQLAQESFDLLGRLAMVSMRGHRRIVGTGQRTTQSLRLADGVVIPQFDRLRHKPNGELFRDETGRPVRYDLGGDGTVYRYAGNLQHTEEHAVAQQHGALPRCKSVIDAVCGVLTHAPDDETVLGGSDLGLSVPDFVPTNEPFEIVTTGIADPARVTCKIENAGDYDEQVLRPNLRWRADEDDSLAAQVVLTTPGLYRVLVSAGADPVTQLVMVDDPRREDET